MYGKVADAVTRPGEPRCVGKTNEVRLDVSGRGEMSAVPRQSFNNGGREKATGRARAQAMPKEKTLETL